MHLISEWIGVDGYVVDFLVDEGPVVFRIDAQFLQLVEDLKSIDDFAKDCVLQVQGRLRAVCEEELRLIAVGPVVGH